ncbi:heat shock protein [Salix suchowensis]|nr:heat shock protein [Salix suchowensis]
MSVDNFDFTDKTRRTITAAVQLAKDYANAQGEDEQSGGLGDTSSRSQSLFHSAISKAGGDPTAYTRSPPEEVYFNGPALKVLREAQSLQKTMHDSYIAQDHLLLAVLKDATIQAIIKEAGLTEATLKTAIEQARGNRRIESKTAEQGFDALQKYAVDLTALAEEGKIDPVIGRDNEIRRVIRILCRRTKNNPVLIGEPGVGKTSIAEGLAQRIVKRDVPASLISRLYSLDMGALMAGGSIRVSEYEERIKAVLNEVEKASEDGGPGVILFVDELHLIMAGRGAEGGGMDAANLFKPLLARGKLRCIGATTLPMNEPSVLETISILRGIREKYEVHHGVRILDGALIQAATLAHRYLTSRRLPDAAIDLHFSVRVNRETEPEAIDKLQRKRLELEIEIHALEREKDAASKERLQAAKKAISDVDEELQPLQAAFQAEKMRGDELNILRRKMDELKAKIEEAERRRDITTASDLKFYAVPEVQARIEQLEAKKAAEDASTGSAADIVTSEAIADIVGRWTNIPVSRLMSSEKEKLLRMEKILTENVVGQPEAVKAVANAIRLSRSGLANAQRPIASFLFAGPSGTGKTLLSKTLATLLFDSPDAMIRIDGSEYSEKHSIARQLTEYVRRKPYSIILIDEIEKACREFVTLFLQVLDDGRLTDGQGRVVDFRNSTRTLVMGAIQGHFPPEFVNRIDEIVIFRALSQKNVLKIVDIRLKEVLERLAERKITIDIDDVAKSYLSSAGYSPAYGARPLNRAIQSELLNPLSIMILSEQIRDGEVVKVRFDGPHNRLNIIPNHEATETQGMDVDYDDDDIEIEEMD